MTDKFKAHCNLMHYLEQEHPQMARIVKGSCCDGALTSLKGKPGITFLMPVEKSVISELEKLAFSENVKDVQKASDMIHAMIIKDVFKKAQDWLDKRANIPNSLYPSQHVEVEKVTGSEVHFKSKASAVIDEKFNDSSRDRDGNPRLAIWKLTGKIPIDGQPAKPPMTRPKKGGAVGGSNPDSSQRIRMSIISALESKYCLERSSGRKSNVFIRATAGLIHHIMKVRNEVNTVYDRILPMLSFHNVDIYLLLEPFRTSGQYFLEDVIIKDWWVNHAQFSVKNVIAETINMLGSRHDNSQFYSDRVGLIGHINACRLETSNAIRGKVKSEVEKISAAYEILESRNEIDGVGNVFPQQLHEFYKANPGLKMIQDEVRYLATCKFRDLEARPFDLCEFNEIARMIGSCLATPSRQYYRHILLTRNTFQNELLTDYKKEAIRIFLNSTVFMFISVTEEECKRFGKNSTTSEPMPGSHLMWNIHQVITNRIPQAFADDINIEQFVESLSADEIKILRDKLSSK